MIKCGTLAAVVIAGSAAGTATLVSNPQNADSLAASDQSAMEQMTSVRGTRSIVETVDDFSSPVARQRSCLTRRMPIALLPAISLRWSK
jgi:hypothetical protein